MGFRPDPKPSKREKKKVYFLKRSPLKKKKYRIKRFSEKREKEESIYKVEGPKFIEGKMCAVFPNQPATQVHHKKGRRGYADQWARDNNITLLNDKRFWLAVSNDGHTMIENDPEWAYKKGYSLLRTAK